MPLAYNSLNLVYVAVARSIIRVRFQGTRGQLVATKNVGFLVVQEEVFNANDRVNSPVL